MHLSSPPSSKRILFVTYGGGHAQMVLPVVKWLRRFTSVDVRVLALTTAASIFENADEPYLGFKDFLHGSDKTALARGEELLQGNLSNDVAREESVAYLGLSYLDLEQQMGAAGAKAAYLRFGRQAFRQTGVLSRIISDLAPDIVVATNSPRAERAAIQVAGSLKIPSVCMVDLFAMDEVAWIGQPGYATKVCVLNQVVADRLLAFGRSPTEICVTGNPAFDQLCNPKLGTLGKALRDAQGWTNAQVVLWAAQPEPTEHPSVLGRTGDPTLPGRIQDALELWALKAPGRILVERPHPSQVKQAKSEHSNILRNGRDFDLPALLHSLDGVVTMNSTVGLQAYLAGKPVIQVLGSLFDDSMPLAKYGFALACVDPDELPLLIPDWLARSHLAPSVDTFSEVGAAERVSRVILSLA